MKYAMIIPDGAADVPLDELGGRTPLAAANTPNIDWITAHGKCGTVANVPDGMEPGSDVAMLSVFGYHPRECYTGRAPLEAAAQELKVADDEWVLRCSIVTIIDGKMMDHSAGHISSQEGAAIINELNGHLGSQDLRFYPGVSYRHLLVLKGKLAVKTTPPHDILGQKADDYLPKGRGAKLLVNLIRRSREILRGHEINVIRRDLGESPATSIWLWGQGKMPQLASFGDRFSISAAVITAVDLVRGIAKLIGWDCIEVQGATGYVDTNYAGKGQAAAEALDYYDLVCVHVEGTDEAGHNADPLAKVHALEQIDSEIVAPVLERLRAEGNDWRIMVLPDHPTPCTVRTHTTDPVPFTLAGAGVETLLADSFTEESAAASDLHIAVGSDLMEYFLTVR
ncbi:MAG: cofactor-independent phosphoglycerate mutase [Phycisphaerae bacterium]|nr:cofactor-independent phosphoglycerate mutase [Phycisphaerae bacterium]